MIDLTKFVRKIAAVAILVVAFALAGQAQAANVTVATPATSANIGPFNADGPVFGYGADFRVDIDMSAAATAGNRVVALLYQDGTYVTRVLGTAGTAADPFVSVVTLPNLPSTYNEVVLVVDIGNGTDAYAAGADEDYYGVILGFDSRTQYDIASTNDAGWKATADAIGLASEFAAIADDAYTAADAGAATLGDGVFPMTTYSGPVLQSAQSDDLLAATDVKLTFNAVLESATLTDTTDVSSQVTVQSGAADVGTAMDVNGNVAAGALLMRIDDNGAAFGAPIDNVDIALDGAGAITDEAGNPAQPVTSLAITEFAAPAFAGRTADVLVTGGSAVAANDMAAMYAVDGTGLLLDNGQTVILTGYLSEAYNGGTLNAADDYALVPAGLEALAGAPNVGGAASGTFTITLTFAGDNDYARINPTSGALEVALDAGTAPDSDDDWTAVTFGLTVGATPIATAEAIALATATATESVFNSITATPTVATSDAINATGGSDPDGVLDGVVVEFTQPITQTLPGTTGATLADRDTTTTTVASAAAVVTGDTSKLRVTASTQASIVALLAGAETQADNLGTGATNATPIPYDFRLLSSAITYSSVYDTDGELMTLPDIAFAGGISDGAGPIITAAECQRQGSATASLCTLVLTASENLVFNASVDDFRLEGLAADAAPLPLINLTDGLTAVDPDGPDNVNGNGDDEATIATTTLTIENLSSNILGDALTVVADTKVQDAGGNELATDSDGVTIATGDVTYTAPTFESAVVARSSATANFDSIIARFDRAIDTDSTASPDPVFQLQISPNDADFVDAEDITLNVPAANVDFPSSDTTLAIVTIPSPGLPSNLSANPLAALRLDYNATTADALIVSADDATVTMATGNVAVRLPANTTGIWSMDIKGSVQNSSAAPANGSYVRADLVECTNDLAVDRVVFTRVPCDCTTGGSTLADVDASLLTRIEQARRVGLTTISDAAIRVVKDNGQLERVGIYGTVAAAQGAETDGPNDDTDDDSDVIFAVSITGFTGTNPTRATVTGTNISGTVYLERTEALQILDTGYALLGGGSDFRATVGTTTQPEGTAFVLVTAIVPGQDAVLMTQADDAFTNHLPFASNVTSKSTVTNLGTVDIATDIDSMSVDDVNGWQLLGLTGGASGNKWSRNTGANGNVDIRRAFISIDQDGNPSTLIKADSNTTDEAFTLIANTMKSFVEVTAESFANNITNLDSGYGLALFNDGNFSRDNDGDGIIGDGGSTVAIENDVERDDAAYENFKLFVPVSSTARTEAVGANWSLLTNLDGAALSVGSLPANVAAVIKVGNGMQAKTWFRGESNNTLTQLESGEAYFVFFSSANASTFAFFN